MKMLKEYAGGAAGSVFHQDNSRYPYIMDAQPIHLLDFMGLDNSHPYFSNTTMAMPYSPSSERLK